MSSPRIIIASLLSFCQNYQNWWKFDKVLSFDKTNLRSFLRHGVLLPLLNVTATQELTVWILEERVY